MYTINWKVAFNNSGQKTELGLVEAIEVVSSVDNLTDTATLRVPEAVLNTPLNFNNRIERGTEVEIQLGYNEDLKTEFIGYVTEVVNHNSSIEIKCEDALFLFRKSISNKEFKAKDITDIAKYLVSEIDPSFSVESELTIVYETFTIYNATAFDVLKKLQSETKANVYFDTKNKVLHIHPPYVEVGDIVKYSMQKNIETSSLEYKQKSNQKKEVVIESTNKQGKINKVEVGDKDGDKITLKVGPMDVDSMKNLAESILKKENSDKYQGTFNTWLIPSVSPTDSVEITDNDYPKRTGRYYAASVKTNVSASGAVRTITPTIKLSI